MLDSRLPSGEANNNSQNITNDKVVEMITAYKTFWGANLPELIDNFLEKKGNGQHLLTRISYHKEEDITQFAEWGKKYFTEILNPDVLHQEEEEFAKSIVKYNDRQLILLSCYLLNCELENDFGVYSNSFVCLTKIKEEDICAYIEGSSFSKIQLNLLAVGESKKLFDKLKIFKSEDGEFTHIQLNDSFLFSFDPTFADTNLNYLKEVANTGNISGKITLAICYRDGALGAQQDINKAKHLFMEAATQGSSNALCLFAALHYPDNHPNIWKLQRLAAENRNYVAILKLISFFEQPSKKSFLKKSEPEKKCDPALIYHSTMQFGQYIRESKNKKDIARLNTFSNLFRTQPQAVEKLALELNDGPEKILTYMDDEEKAVNLMIQDYITSPNDKYLPQSLLQIISDYAVLKGENASLFFPEPADAKLNAEEKAAAKKDRCVIC